MIYRRSSTRRIAAALFAAAGVAALPTVLLGVLAIIAYPIGFGIALGHGLCLGLPAYVVLCPNVALGWAVAALAGFIVGATPFALYLVATSGTGSGGFLIPGLFGLCGLAGGLTFRAVLGNGAQGTEIFDASIWE